MNKLQYWFWSYLQHRALVCPESHLDAIMILDSVPLWATLVSSINPFLLCSISNIELTDSFTKILSFPLIVVLIVVFIIVIFG